MDRRTKIILVVGALIVAGYIAWRYYESKKNNESSGTGQLGSNLNSVAPELIGGSTGPSLGPAVSLPININLTTSEAGSGISNGSANYPLPYQSNPNVGHQLNGGQDTAGTTGAIAAGRAQSAAQAQGNAAPATAMQSTSAKTANPVHRQTKAAHTTAKNGGKVQTNKHPTTGATRHKAEAKKKVA
jgi:hypothetical protein